MTKISTKQVGISSVAEYSATVDQIAELTVRRDKIQARLDKAILDAREEHGPELESLNNQITAKVAMAETYAIRNRDALLSGDAKSGDTPKARWGFRLGNPTLVLLSRKFTWSTVTAKLKDMGLTKYLKVSDPKPDKDRIKADMDDTQLADLGLRIEQTEAFWVEPKTDTAERINA